jgi:two-component system response regulator RegA
MRAETAPSVLVVDDDVRFAETLARALERRGWAANVAHTIDSALAVARAQAVDAAIVDLRLGDEDGLELIKPLQALGERIRIVVLTGYASIATAVRAIKLGADDYLAKPVTASAVVETLQRGEKPVAARHVTQRAEPMSPRRLEWEHIHRVLAEHAGNLSATARALKMHRRTLQRKLAKKPLQS